MCDSDKAFLFWQGTPTDPKFMDEYIKKVDATLKPYGGEFLVRGKHAESGHVSGNVEPPHAIVVVIQFEGMEKALAWKESDEYKKIVGARD